jgi:uncharacterized protein (AIM24 family)
MDHVIASQAGAPMLTLRVYPGEQAVIRRGALVTADAGAAIGAIGGDIPSFVRSVTTDDRAAVRLARAVPGTVERLPVHQDERFVRPMALLAGIDISVTASEGTSQQRQAAFQPVRCAGSGAVFVGGCGDIDEERLSAGETMTVAAAHLLAIDGAVDIETVADPTDGGRPFYELTGAGSVWFQSRALTRLDDGRGDG